MPDSTTRDMLAAYQTAAKWRSSVRSALVSNELTNVVETDSGAGIATFNDAGVARHVQFCPGSCETSIVDEPLEVMSRPNLRGSQSPCGRFTLDVRDHNLWLVHADGRDDTRLTTDGTAEFAYGLARQIMPGEGRSQFVALWSPDGNYVITQRLDLRGVRRITATESAPRGGGWPVMHTWQDSFPGDDAVPHVTIVVVNTLVESVCIPPIAPIAATHTSPLLRRDVWWNATSNRVYLVVSSRDWLELSLVSIDPVTGESVTLISERSDRRIRPSLEFHQAPCVVVHDDPMTGAPREALWFSERDGWGHLYRYSFSSDEPEALVTKGDFAIASVVAVDWQARTVWANVAGLVPADPYRESMCAFDIDSGAVTRLFNDELDHRTVFISSTSPQSGWFVDAASSVADPTQYSVRDWSGRHLADLGSMDVSRLTSTGWRAPERFSALADDGETKVFGTIFFPPDFDEGVVYPIIDHVYSGPQMHRSMPWFAADDIEPYVALGMVGVTIDGRGTPGRERSFYDHSWRNVGAGSGLADHVAAIKQLAATRPWMDTTKVAIHGRSAGGFGTARAMELFPDFFKVGIAAAGRFEGRMVMAMIMEAYDDPYDAESWERASAVAAGGDISGKFLIVHGEMDVDCTIHHAYRLIDKMIEANRDFDLLVIPGDGHTFPQHNNYVERRIWDYLTEHALGQHPPKGFVLTD